LPDCGRGLCGYGVTVYVPVPRILPLASFTVTLCVPTDVPPVESQVNVPVLSTSVNIQVPSLCWLNFEFTWKVLSMVPSL